MSTPFDADRLFKDFAKENIKLVASIGGAMFLVILYLLKAAFIAYDGDHMLKSILYLKAHLRSLLFFLPDSFMNVVSSGNYNVHFLKVLKAGAPHQHWLTCGFMILGIGFSAVVTHLIFLTFCGFELSRSMGKMSVSGRVMDKEEYQKRNDTLFGYHCGFAGLKLSERALWYPIFAWGATDKTESQINGIEKHINDLIVSARTQKKQLIIFEDGDSLYKKFSHDGDILLNPLAEHGNSWNFLEDFQKNENISKYMEKKIMTPCGEYLQAFRSYNDLKDSDSFLSALCFDPIKVVKSTLKKIIPLESLKEVETIRQDIAEEFEFLSHLPKKKKEVSLTNSNSIIWVSGFNKNAMKKLSRFILETADDRVIKIVSQTGSHDIKKTGTIVINSGFKEFHIRFDGSILALGNTENNDKVSELFWPTTYSGLTFAGKMYHNINIAAVPISELEQNKSFFRYGDYQYSNDILRF